jgi:hypothetical protein
MVYQYVHFLMVLLYDQNSWFKCTFFLSCYVPCSTIIFCHDTRVVVRLNKGLMQKCISRQESGPFPLVFCLTKSISISVWRAHVSRASGRGEVARPNWSLSWEKIPFMPWKIVAHVLYAIENWICALCHGLYFFMCSVLFFAFLCALCHWLHFLCVLCHQKRHRAHKKNITYGIELKF